MTHSPQAIELAEASTDALFFLDPIADQSGEVLDFGIAYSNMPARQMFSHVLSAPDAGTTSKQSVTLNLPFLATHANLHSLRSVLALGTSACFTLAIQEPGVAAEWLSVSAARFDTGLVLTMADLTMAREAEHRICRQVQQDTLTGLPNRNLLDDRIQQAIRRAGSHQQSAAVLLLDLDDFGRINRHHGRPAGDHVLQVVSQRLSDVVRSTDSVIRLRADEFVVILPDILAGRSVAEFEHTILSSLCHPILWLGQELHVTASIGVALYPECGTTPETLLVQADIDRNQRKQANLGGSRFQPRIAERKEPHPFSLLVH